MCKNNRQIILGFSGLLILSLSVLFYLPLWKYYSDSSATYLFFRDNYFFYELLTLGLLLAVGIYWWLDRKLIKNPPRLSIILISLAILSLILLAVFPIGASDIFLYLTQARTFAFHGLSPYVATYSQLTNDIFYPFLKDNRWANYTSSYGPFFTLITGGLARIFKSDLLATILLFKGFFAACHLANTWLVDKTLGRRFAWLYAFNPLILFEFLINGHNEVLMIFFCLLSFYFLWQKTPSLKNSLFSIFFLTLGILIKFIPLLLLPVWGLALLWRLKDRVKKILFIGLSIPLIIGTGFLAYLPFGLGSAVLLKPIMAQMHFFNCLLTSPAVTFIYNLLAISKIANPWGLAILISRGLFVCFLLFIATKIIRGWREKNVKKLLNYGALIILAFDVSFFSWLMPWYFTFLLLLLLISHSLNNRKGYLITFYATTVIGLTYYLILR